MKPKEGRSRGSGEKTDSSSSASAGWQPGGTCGCRLLSATCGNKQGRPEHVRVSGVFDARPLAGARYQASRSAQRCEQAAPPGAQGPAPPGWQPGQG